MSWDRVNQKNAPEIQIVDNIWKRKCKDCNDFKEYKDFYQNPAGAYGIDAICKVCKLKRSAIREQENPNIAKEKALKRKYNMNLEEFNQMLQAQEGKCLICEKLMIEPYVDHNHNTGETRGLLCHQCNTGIGMFADNPELIIKAAAYLESKKKL